MLSLWIATRYLRAPKSHAATGVITAIATIGVAVTTAALLVVLSVFNGFREVITARLSLLDPQLVVVPVSGKAIATGDDMAMTLSVVDGVALAMPVVSDRALAVHGGTQQPVVIKGVPAGYAAMCRVDSVMVDGYWHDDLDGACVPGSGPAIALRVYSGMEDKVRFYAPRRVGKINLATPAGAFTVDSLAVAGVFELSQDGYDAQLVYTSLEMARRLFNYTTEATAVELRLTADANEADVMQRVSDIVGEEYVVRDRVMQQAEAYRMINVEKWMTSLLLAFIMLIATFNVIGAMALLITEKRDNLVTLRSMGATDGFLRRVFMVQSVLITAAGVVPGIVVGALLCLGQQHYGWLKISGDASSLIVSSYPVSLAAGDVVIVLAVAAVIAVFTALLTARLVPTARH